MTHPALRLLVTVVVILGVWQLVVVMFDMPSFILPAPVDVLDKLLTRYDVLLKHSWVTAQEILLGLALGLSMGLLFALQMLMFEPLKRWLLPILIASKAISICHRASVDALARLWHCIESGDGGHHYILPGDDLLL